MMDLEEDQAKKLVTYVTASTKHVIETCGPRPPGSDGELKALEFMKAELADLVDQATIEPFKVAQKAFMAFEPVVGLSLALGAISFWFMPIASLLLALFALLVFVAEFAVYKQFLDFFWPKRLSHNLVGIKKPASTIKRRVILNAHVDAAYENRFSKATNAKILPWAIIGMLLSIVASGLNTAFNFWWQWGYASWWSVLGIPITCFLPVYMLVMCYNRYSVVAPGANDDLAAAFIVIAIAKHLSENNIPLQNTEIWYVVTGSEEAGLRGAKAFAKVHAPAFNDVDTRALVFEIPFEPASLCISSVDLNGTVQLDPGMIRLLQVASKESGNELSLMAAKFGVGSTDAAAFQQSGIPSSGLLGMKVPPAPEWYHTRADNMDNVNPAGIERMLTVALDAVFLFDKQGIAEKGE